MSERRGLMTMASGAVAQHLRKCLGFAAVSITGLALDVCVFMGLLLSTRAQPFVASAASSLAAVTFVYFASVHRVFRYAGQFHLAMFATYAAYQACGIAAGSWAVQSLVTLGLPAAVSKLAIVPITFSANYLFMCWLTSDPARWPPRVRS